MIKIQETQFARVAAAAFLAVCMQGAVAGLRPVEVPPSEAPAAQSAPRPAPRVVEQRGERDPFYDHDNPGYARLQRSSEALDGLPVDRDGKVDWVSALRAKEITPRERLDGSPREPALELDIIMRNTKQMPNVRFPHRAHTEWLDCVNCHPDPFAQKAGTATIRMEDIFRGNFCGKCHDRVAFVTHRNCYRCHSVNPDGTPARAP